MGGTDTQIHQAPTTAAPGAGESAAELYEARMQYDPLVAAMELELAQKYGPQYGELYNQISQQQFPGLEQLRITGTEQAQQRLESPFAMTPDEEAAMQAIRGRTRGQVQKNVRERANLGGQLYGGRAELSENRAMGELEQAFGAEDINRRMQAGQQAQQGALPYLQILYPQIQQQQAVSRGVTPSADSLYNAMFQASQPQSYAVPGAPSPMWDIAGSIAGGASAALTAGAMNSSKRYKDNIKLWGKPSIYSSN